MKISSLHFRFVLFLSFVGSALCAQNQDSTGLIADTHQVSDTTEANEMLFYSLLNEIRAQQIADSIERVSLLHEITSLKSQSNETSQTVQDQLALFEAEKNTRDQLQQLTVDSIKKHSSRYAVAPFRDTLFFIYTKLGSSLANERAVNVQNRIRTLYDDDFAKVDSFLIENNEITSDLIYNDLIITSITEQDALLEGKSREEVAQEYLKRIKNAIHQERMENSLTKTVIRIGLILTIIALFFLLIRLINRATRHLNTRILKERSQRIKDIKIKNYTLVTSVQKTRILVALINILRWAIIVVTGFIMLPIIFSIFPFTQSWAKNLIGLFTKPIKATVFAVWNYIPDLITVIVIMFVMRYLIRLIRYIFGEVDKGKLEINGFHQDFAMPTFTIVRFLLYAFTLVLIFPYLPGSKSDIFKGVSVFIGILFSLGSSSAISNIVAGLVITYMRPFRIGDRITIADKTGVVIEKSPLVTRLRTIKNEEITIPNSSILSGNTINYSTFSNEGICIQMEVSVGYEEPWEKVHALLLAIPPRIKKIKTNPKPFVLQKRLDDYYILYELNAYVQKSGEADFIRSEVYKLILNDFIAAGIDMNTTQFFSTIGSTKPS